MGKSAKAPDYTAAAEKQAESSREVTEQQTWANRPDQVTPFGSQKWASTPTYDPTTGQTLNRWTQTTELTPETQRALDSQVGIQQGRSDLAKGMMDRVYQEYGPTMDWSKFGTPGATPEQRPLQSSLDTSGMQRVNSGQRYYNEAGDAVASQFSRRMEPQFQQDSDRLDQTLRNRGLRPGDQAYDSELAKLRQTQGDQRLDMADRATQLSGQEAGRMFGMDSSLRGQQFGEAQTGANLYNTTQGQMFGQGMSAGNFDMQRRQQQISEEMQKRGFSLNEINAILSGQQVGMPSMPGFNSAGKSEGVQYSTAAQQQYSAAQDAANAQNAMFGSLMGGASSALSMFSDMRMKRGIRRVGTTSGGSRVYAYKYIGGLVEHVGVLAQIEALSHPENVGIADNGMLFVNYAGVR